MKNRLLSSLARIDWWLVATISTQWLLISTTFLKVLPVTNGFFLYWAKLASSSVIYRDFFFPLPPVGLLVDGFIPRMFPDPLFAEQILQGSKWLLISVVLYLILVNLDLSKFAAYVGASVSASAYYCSPVNITAGYLELAWLLLLLGVLFGIIASRDARKWSPWLSAAACAFSLAFLTKQSAIIPCVAAICILVFIRWDSKKIAWSMSSAGQAIAGAAAPFIIFGIVGLIEGNLFDAISNVSSGGGKNALNSFLPFVWLTSGLGFQTSWLPILSISFGLLLLSFRHKLSDHLDHQLGTALLGIGISSLVIGQLALMNIGPLVSGTSQSILLALTLAAVISIGLGAFYTELRAKSKKSRFQPWFLLPIASWAFVLGGTTASAVDPLLGQWLPQFTQINTVGGIASIGVGVAAITSRKLNGGMNRPLLLTFSIAFGFAITNAFSGNLSIETWLLGLAVAVAWVLKIVSDSLTSIFSKVSISLIFLLLLFPFSAIQANNPYDWWGIRSEPLASERGTPRLPSLTRFDLGSRTVQTYDELAYGLEKSLEMRGPNARVLLGPNLAGLAGGVFADLNTYPLKCPILWWDLCSQANTEIDFKRIVGDPPEIIVWNIAPEAVASGHEAGFNNGKPSSLRHVQEWILSQIPAGYTQITRLKLLAGDPPEALTFETVVLARNSP